MLGRSRFEQAQTLAERLLQEALQLREQARLLPPGKVREAALKNARQAETAARMQDWINSTELQPPKERDIPGPD